MTDDRALWVKRLRAAAESTLGKAPAIPAPGTFRDERRNQLEIDEGLFAALRSTVWTAPALARGDVKLWSGWEDGDGGGDGGEPVDAVVLPDIGGEGRPLLGDWMNQPFDQPHVGMEEWGERELCGLHALWSRARTAEKSRQTAWLRRGYSACRWLLENLQPDNATNMPWSAHVWVLAAGPGPWGPGLGPEARVYAETLLHNCQVGGGLGRPDKRSAWVLFHAASELEHW